MNPIPALRDYPQKFLQAILGSIGDFKGAPCYEARVVHSKDQRVKKWFVLAVERAVYEYVVLIANKRHGFFTYNEITHELLKSFVEPLRSEGTF